MFPLGDSDTLPPPLSTTAPEIESVAKLLLPEIRPLLAMRSTSVNVPKLSMSTIEPDAIVAPLSTPLLATISPPARVCSLPPEITAPPKATCAPLPEAKIVPVLVLLMLAASMSVPPVVASSLPALIVLALRKSVETVLASMVPLLTTVRPPPPMKPAPAIVLLTLLKIAPGVAAPI